MYESCYVTNENQYTTGQGDETPCESAVDDNSSKGNSYEHHGIDNNFMVIDAQKMRNTHGQPYAKVLLKPTELFNSLCDTGQNIILFLTLKSSGEGEEPNRAMLHLLTFLGGFLLFFANSFYLLDLLSILITPLLYVLHLYQAFFALILMVSESGYWEYMAQPKEWMLHWLRFLTVPFGKAVFCFFVGSLTVASCNTSVFMVILGFYMLVMGTTWVTVHVRSTVKQIPDGDLSHSTLPEPVYDDLNRQETLEEQDGMDFPNLPHKDNVCQVDDCLRTTMRSYWNATSDSDIEQQYEEQDKEEKNAKYHQVSRRDHHQFNRSYGPERTTKMQYKNSPREYRMHTNTLTNIRLPRGESHTKTNPTRPNEYFLLNNQPPHYTTSTASSLSSGPHQSMGFVYSE